MVLLLGVGVAVFLVEHFKLFQYLVPLPLLLVLRLLSLHFALVQQAGLLLEPVLALRLLCHALGLRVLFGSRDWHSEVLRAECLHPDALGELRA